MLVSICWKRIDKTINKSISLFHTQFVLDLFFFSKPFQSHCIYKIRESFLDQLSWTTIRGNFHGGYYPRGNHQGVNCLGKIFSGTILLGGNCPRRQLSGEGCGSNNPGAIFWVLILEFPHSNLKNFVSFL